MPLAQSVNAFVGAALLGIVGAAGMYLVEYYRHDKQRHEMAKDLARLDQELSSVRRELDQLLSKQKHNGLCNFTAGIDGRSWYEIGFVHRPARERFTAYQDQDQGSETFRDGRETSFLDKIISRVFARERNVKPKKHSLSNGPRRSLDTRSDAESSDLEFYDVSDYETDTETVSPSASGSLSSALQAIDYSLDEGDLEEVKRSLDSLKELRVQHPTNENILWRIGKAYHKIYEKLDPSQVEERKEAIFRGTEACELSLKLKSDNGVAHKWMAILLGIKGEFLPMKERIAGTHLFKEHVRTAIEYDPSDPSLHHMLGRLSYELAGLKWYERQVASAIFGAPPSASYEEARGHFLQAEERSTSGWKTNELYLAKVSYALGDYKEACAWIERAAKLTDVDESINKEVEKLVKEYAKYR